MTIGYRPEVDGLRAVAVVPVILFHAALPFVSGGFVGVDVFFVISGYLITGIILSDVAKGRFSVTGFYARRVRRILPALYVVMAVSTAIAYQWMLPDELENFGQSLVATTLFANNILLILTTGYWDLAAEFKPLLHTWSLAVEEQFYLIFPWFLIAAWRYARRQIAAILFGLFVVSLVAAQWGSTAYPEGAFYLLVTRAWELILGAFAAIRLRNGATPQPEDGMLSMIGLLSIAIAVFSFDAALPTPSHFTLLPTLGAFLIILHARPGTAVFALLSQRTFVWVGLISYSAYLWHFPLFAFARIYSVHPLGVAPSLALSLASIGLAYLTWKFVEQPCRTRKASQGTVFGMAALVSIVFLVAGYHLHSTHGVPQRLYSEDVSSGDALYIAYNEKAFRFSKRQFSSTDKMKVLVAGNSFGRDFVNMTVENFDLSRVELVYRSDFGACLDSRADPLARAADIIVIVNDFFDGSCVRRTIESYGSRARVFYIGLKHFGYNLNWIARLEADQRRNLFNPLPAETVALEERMRRTIPPENFISLLDPVVSEQGIPVTDEEGRLLSLDRLHLTRYGAQYLGQRALVHSPYGLHLMQNR